MASPVYPHLFKPLKVDGVRLKNRITMAPLYLGYAAEGGKVSRLMLDHYRRMAGSGAAMVVVENASITPGGSGSERTLRCDHNRYIPGLAELAQAIQKKTAKAALQINHAGRFARVADPVAPSAVETFGRTPRALTRKEILTIEKQYAAAARRVKEPSLPRPTPTSARTATAAFSTTGFAFPSKCFGASKTRWATFRSAIVSWPTSGSPTASSRRKPQRWPRPWKKTARRICR
jgi:hypothetical protein